MARLQATAPQPPCCRSCIASRRGCRASDPMPKPQCSRPADLRLQKPTRVPSKAFACRSLLRRSKLRVNVTDSRQRLRLGLGLGNEARPTARSELRISPDGRVHQVLATLPVLPRAQGREHEPCRPSLRKAVTFTQIHQFFWCWTLGLHGRPRQFHGPPADHVGLPFLRRLHQVYRNVFVHAVFRGVSSATTAALETDEHAAVAHGES